MAKDLRFVMLLDCYGEFLTERQRQVCEYYYGEDLSLGEISEISGITRQAVRDSIKRSEEIILDMENKLCFAERLEKLREIYRDISAAVCDIKTECAGNPDIIDKCSIIDENVGKGMKLL